MVLIRSFITLFFLWAFINSNAQSEFIFGQDLSYANMMEDCGADFREDGEIKDIFHIFADNGTNLVRVRLWHNPDWQESLSQPSGVKSQYNNFEDAKETIFRAKMAGMKVMLEFQFSDFWCEPGRQILPKAWENVSDNEPALKDTIYNYVFRILTKMNEENLMPEFVKIGNENNSGIMTHKGMDSNYNGITMLSSSWARHGRLYNAAIKAVRDVSALTSIKPKIALHVADPKNADWFYNNIISNGVTDFDIMGFTYYYAYHYGSPNTVGNVIKTLLQIHPTYEAMVVETGYLWDTENIDGLGNIITTPSPDYLPVNPANQKKFMVDLTNAVMNAGGSGVIFWEPDWVSTPCRTPWGVGSSQEHVAFFDHRNNLNYMKNGAGGWPDAIINGEQLSEVKITFKVDMTGINVNNGVYITGSFTGSSNWSILPMNNEGNNIYSYTVEMLPSDVGAFYFLNNNDWDARETVPVECALMWNIDRKYIIGENDTVIAVKWGTCESFTTTVSKLSFSNGIKIYPNPNSGQQIIIENINKEPLTEIEFLNSLGQKEGIVYSYINNKSQITIYFKQIKKGFYFIKIKGNESVYSQKIIIN